MKNICLVLLVGLPAAGKTTFCYKLVKWIDPNFYNIKIYHFDDYLNTNDYHNSRSKVTNLIRTDIERFSKEEHNVPLLIVLDDNMMYKSMRNHYLKLAKELELSYSMIYFCISLELALERNKQRINKVPTNVLLKINEVFEPPLDTFVINPTDFNSALFEKFIIYIRNCLKAPLKLEKKVVNLPVAELPLKHRVDLILRSIVNKRIKENKHYSDMNLIKIEVYKKYKSGEINIDHKLNENEITEFLEQYFP